MGAAQPVRRRRKRYEGLRAWIACHEVALAVYRATAVWPPAEQDGLAAQARRAAYSAAAHIAEGAARQDPRQFRRFLDIALGSLGELAYVLLLATELGLLPQSAYGELEALRDHANQLTAGLHRALAAAQRPRTSVGQS